MQISWEVPPPVQPDFADMLPKGVVNMALGRWHTVGLALINHPKIAVTGDIAMGCKIMQAAHTINCTHLELGG